MRRAVARTMAGAGAILAVAAAAAGAATVRPQAPQITAACPADLPDGGYCGDGGPVTSAKLASPRDVAAVPGGFLIADGQNHVIRRVTGATISTAAGIGIAGDRPPARGRPGSIADFALSDPRGITALPGGSYAIADAGLRAVLLVGADGRVRTLRDGATLVRPVDVVARDDGTLVIADVGAGRLLEVDPAGRGRTLARGLTNPWQVALDPASGGIYVSEQREDSQGDVVLIRPDGSRSVVAGPGAPGFAGTLRFERVSGIVAQGDVLVVADRTVARAVFPGGAVQIVAGFSPGKPEPINGINLVGAEGLALTAGGQLLIADAGRDQVATAPSVPASAAVDPAQALARPTTRLVGMSPLVSAGRTQAPSPRLTQAPGSPAPCTGSGLPPDLLFQKVAKRGTLLVRYPGSGWLRVELQRPGASRLVSLRRQNVRASRTGLVRVSTGTTHGKFYVRVNAPGGCRRSQIAWPM